MINMKLQLIRDISHEKTWTWLKNWNLKRESLLITTQNNAIRTNYIKIKIDKTQQNSSCRLCDDRDETINRIISEWNKLAQKEYKTRHDWVGEAIHSELCKKLKSDHANKWYIPNPEFVLENEKHKLLWDTNGSPNIGQTTRPNNNQQEKENLSNCRLCCPSWS